MNKLQAVKQICYDNNLYHFGDTVLTVEIKHHLITVSENGLLIIDGQFNEGTDERKIFNEILEIMNDRYYLEAVGTE